MKIVILSSSLGRLAKDLQNHFVASFRANHRAEDNTYWGSVFVASVPSAALEVLPDTDVLVPLLDDELLGRRFDDVWRHVEQAVRGGRLRIAPVVGRKFNTPVPSFIERYLNPFAPTSKPMSDMNEGERDVAWSWLTRSLREQATGSHHINVLRQVQRKLASGRSR